MNRIEEIIRKHTLSYDDELDVYEITDKEIKKAAQEIVKLCNIPLVSKSVCKHEWIMTADSFDQTCFCKKCGKSS